MCRHQEIFTHSLTVRHACKTTFEKQSRSRVFLIHKLRSRLRRCKAQRWWPGNQITAAAAAAAAAAVACVCAWTAVLHPPLKISFNVKYRFCLPFSRSVVISAVVSEILQHKTSSVECITISGNITKAFELAEWNADLEVQSLRRNNSRLDIAQF